MPLPLPSVVYDTKPGGALVTSLGGINSLRDQFLKTNEQSINNQFLPQKLQNQNTLGQLVNKFYEPNILSQIAQTQAQTNKINTMTPLEAMELSLKNSLYPQLTQSQIASNYSLSNLRGIGGGRGGVNATQDLMLINNLMKENPELNRDEAFEAAGLAKSGSPLVLGNGKTFKIGGNSDTTLKQILKSTTTAGLLTQGTRANQAHSELEVMSGKAQEALEPYGSTIAGISPQQYIDTFKNDDESQLRLGKFIAGQTLQNEIAQLRTRLAGAQPSVTQTQELEKLSQQSINAQYPVLSYKARKEANRFLNETLKEGLQARNKLGLSFDKNYPSNTTQSSSSKRLKWNIEKGDWE